MIGPTSTREDTHGANPPEDKPKTHQLTCEGCGNWITKEAGDDPSGWVWDVTEKFPLCPTCVRPADWDDGEEVLVDD